MLKRSKIHTGGMNFFGRSLEHIGSMICFFSPKRMHSSSKPSMRRNHPENIPMQIGISHGFSAGLVFISDEKLVSFEEFVGGLELAERHAL